MKSYFSASMVVGLLCAASPACAYNTNSDELAMPCERTITMEEITKAVIPMTPMRSVNIIFPYKLPNETTTYVLSGSNIWQYHKANGSKLVAVSFKSFDEALFGEVHDLTISTPNHLVSLALKADSRHHCTNIVLKLPPEEQRKLDEADKNRHLANLEAEYQSKYDALDKRAMELALSFVGSLTNESPKTTRIYEEAKILNSDGETIKLYVDEVESYGKFNIIKFELDNDSKLSPVNIDGITAGLISENNQRAPITGYADYQRMLSANSKATYLFTTTDPVPEKNGFLTLETDHGKLDVTW